MVGGKFTLTPFHKAYLSLGSNLDAAVNLRSAINALRARFGDIQVSRIYVFPAVGFEGADFLNAAAVIVSDLDPFELNAWLHELEAAHGRVRSGPRFGDRTLDIDIVFYDELVLDGPGHLQIPRDDIKHAFVLQPLAEIAPGFIDPLSALSLAQLWHAHAEHGLQRDCVVLD